eukprot:CAMPEP_0181120876 /NCGR_PEP_ID=MMETSP1071-20121207/24413_1 /TAXON_ID=35127 /ORGANISM="Thalassiosira sp., Strain NH16" /LENGTH=188 /DNA_ID=CAMNT_0023205607 /DNA_START=318 /DNA_END=884 /DNA_ORIENTATION=-
MTILLPLHPGRLHVATVRRPPSGRKDGEESNLTLPPILAIKITLPYARTDYHLHPKQISQPVPAPPPYLAYRTSDHRIDVERILRRLQLFNDILRHVEHSQPVSPREPRGRYRSVERCQQIHDGIEIQCRYVVFVHMQEDVAGYDIGSDRGGSSLDEFSHARASSSSSSFPRGIVMIAFLEYDAEGLL